MRPSPLLASLALLLLLAAPAEARFGKRSRPAPPSASAPHAATPPEAEEEHPDDEHPDEEEDDAGCHGCGSGLGFMFSLFTAPAHQQAHLASGSAGAVSRGYLPLSLTLGLEGLALPRAGGGGAAARLALEGERWGVSFRALGLGLEADDGSWDQDHLSLLEAHVTYALLSTDRLRLRLEAGLHQAQAPDATFLAPSVAGSLEACVVGPLDVELRLQLAPFPHRVLDAQAGLALHLGPFALHGGWRGLVLDDAGLLDGVRHTDALGGPYVGASMSF
ncbi:MAG TPA: hypothetical protein VFO83_11780 [Aggregicoccus sp.]|nr:hypothetical protein [Aggregicoccus sp.]